MSWTMDPVDPKNTVQGGRGHCKGLSRAAIDAGMKEVWRKNAKETDEDNAEMILSRDEDGFYCLDIEGFREYFDTLGEAQGEAAYHRRSNA